MRLTCCQFVGLARPFLSRLRSSRLRHFPPWSRRQCLRPAVLPPALMLVECCREAGGDSGADRPSSYVLHGVLLCLRSWQRYLSELSTSSRRVDRPAVFFFCFSWFPEVLDSESGHVPRIQQNRSRGSESSPDPTEAGLTPSPTPRITLAAE